MSAAEVISVETLLAQAHAMELEAAIRYGEFAAQMEVHNNPEVARLFHRLAGIERMHADAIAADLVARGIAPKIEPSLAFAGEEGAETSPAEELDYLMTPYHALEIALRNEERAFAFFDRLFQGGTSEAMQRIAREFALEESEHIRLIREWLARVPKPSDDWAFDPDSPWSPD